jgi:hypothetical protein
LGRFLQWFLLNWVGHGDRWFVKTVAVVGVQPALVFDKWACLTGALKRNAMFSDKRFIVTFMCQRLRGGRGFAGLVPNRGSTRDAFPHKFDAGETLC